MRQYGVSTYLLTSDLIELPGEAALECAGFWGTCCGKNPQPKLSGNYIFTGGNGNTFPAFFDALGRYVFVNLGVSF